MCLYNKIQRNISVNLTDASVEIYTYNFTSNFQELELTLIKLSCKTYIRTTDASQQELFLKMTDGSRPIASRKSHLNRYR